MFIAYVINPEDETVQIAFNNLVKVYDEIASGLNRGIYNPNSIVLNGVPLSVKEFDDLVTVELGNQSSVKTEEGIRVI